MKNNLKETILSYCEIITEDTHSSYAKKLYNEVVSKSLNQSNLDNVSFISFNRKRIEQARKANDNILNYKNAK